jgi:hypothetical protein
VLPDFTVRSDKSNGKATSNDSALGIDVGHFDQNAVTYEYPNLVSSQMTGDRSENFPTGL